MIYQCSDAAISAARDTCPIVTATHPLPPAGSRMESTGEPGRVHCSEAFRDRLAGRTVDLRFDLRGHSVFVKGKGAMTTYWLTRAPAISASVTSATVQEV